MSPLPPPPRALSSDERSTVLAVLHEPRFVDQTPLEVYATLLDEERYLCSPRTMYRILDANAELRERRAQLRHANHPVPQLLAERPNQVWSWDITKLLGPATWTYFYVCTRTPSPAQARMMARQSPISMWSTGWTTADRTTRPETRDGAASADFYGGEPRRLA